MRIKDGVPETAAALRERFGKEMLSPQEVARALGVSTRTLKSMNFHGWIGKGRGQLIAVEVLARQMIG